MTRLVRHLDGDRGSIIPVIPIIILALFVLGGLVVDGSRDLTARGEAQAYAEEAARAGASAVDLVSVDLALDEAKAAQRVRDYCLVVRARNAAVVACALDRTDDAAGITTVSGADTRRIVVHTTVTIRIRTTLLGIVGLSDLSVSGAAKARPFEGLDAGDAG